MRKISLFLMMAADGVGGGAGPGANRPANRPAPGTGPGASQRYNDAVAKATGVTVDTGKKTVPLGNAAAMFSKFEPADLEAMASSGKYEFAPQMMSLEPGQKIEGILEGYGPGNDFENAERPGEFRHVDSWIIASMDGSLRVSILSSTQLDGKLPPFIGLPVVIARNADIKLAGGHRCGDYHVGGPRLADGSTRKWGWVPPKVIEAAATVAALPAGTVDANVPSTPTTNGVAPAQA